mgnify:CR=1 FL=1
MSSKKLLLVAFFLPVLLVFTQCEENIFSFTAPSESETGLIEDGRLLMNEGEYAQAAVKFEAAMDKNPESTTARYLHAKATLHASGFNALTLGNQLTKMENGASIPFMEMSMDSSNLLYVTNNTIIEDLRPISKGLITGKYTKKDVDLDLTIATTASGILGFKDTNNDGLINADDIVLNALFDDTGNFELDSLEALASDPDNLNGLITKADTLIEFAGELLVEVLGDTTDLGFDTETMDEMIQEITSNLGFYYINTGVPGNPGEGDNDGDGLIDEECLDGIDNDSDGLIDEDTLFGATCN